MKDTEKRNFGGGNTAWEEKTLGSYLTSETRLEEVHPLTPMAPHAPPRPAPIGPPAYCRAS